MLLPNCLVLAFVYLRDLCLLSVGAVIFFIFCLRSSKIESQETSSSSLSTIILTYGRGLDDGSVLGSLLTKLGSLSIPSFRESVAPNAILSPPPVIHLEISCFEEDPMVEISASNIALQHIGTDVHRGDDLSKFDRLKLCSLKTIQTLIRNRRRIAQRSSARLEKLRLKRARAITNNRSPGCSLSDML